MAYDAPFGLCAFCGEPAGIILPEWLEWTRLCGPCSRVGLADRWWKRCAPRSASIPSETGCCQLNLRGKRSDEFPLLNYKRVSSRTTPEEARPILSCASGACDEVPREERGAWLRGAAPGGATSP